jgi:predicted nucleotidyltransferase
MHIYAFGSVCRGDVSPGSDVDLLAIVPGFDPRFSPDIYSVYSYERIREIWGEGNPFAWHLSIESKLLYASDQSDFLRSLGRPRPYKRCYQDCEKFFSLFREARESFQTRAETRVFDLSMVFLAIRNFATCFSLGILDKPDFSRSSAVRLANRSLSIPKDAYNILERSRILCTRAIGESITDQEAQIAFEQFPCIEEWLDDLLKEVTRSCSTSLMTA